MKHIAVLFLMLFCFPAVAAMNGQVQKPVHDVDNMTFLGNNLNNFAHIMDVEVSGDRAYVCSGASNGLETYDISNPASPVRLNRTGPAAWNARAYGNKLYVFLRNNGVEIYNISGSIPSKLGGYNPSNANTLYENGVLRGDTLHVAAHQMGLYFLDVANPGSPYVVGHFDLAENACWDVEEYGSHLLVANGRFGLSVVELTSPAKEVAVLPLPGLANHILLDGNVAVISLGTEGLATVDVSNPAAPKFLNRARTGGNAFGSGILDHKVVVGSWHLVETFDVSRPKSIRRIGWDNTKTWAMGADIEPYGSDGLVVVGDWYGMSTYLPVADVGPDIDVSPQYLDFGEVTGTEEEMVLVRNTGTSSLDVTVGSLPYGIQADPNAFTVAPGESEYVRIIATGTYKVYDNIIYSSNDPDEPSVEQFTYKNSTAFPQVGSDAPEFILEDIDGFWHYLSDYKGKVVYLEFGGLW